MTTPQSATTSEKVSAQQVVDYGRAVVAVEAFAINLKQFMELFGRRVRDFDFVRNPP
jgi:hypothetical protein